MKKRTTVLQLINSFSLAGAEKLVFKLAKKINKKYFKVIVCGIGRPKNKKIQRNILNNLRSSGVGCYCLNKKARKERIETFKNLFDLFKKEKVDIVHTHCNSPDFYGKITSFLTQKNPVFSTIHNSKGYNYFHEKFLQKLTTRYIAVSNLVKKYAISKLAIPKNKIKLIYNGIDVEEFRVSDKIRKKYRTKLGIKKNEIAFLNIGRFTIQKNHSLLVESFYRASLKNKNIHLLLVGEGNLKNKTINIIKRYGIQAKVSFLGYREDIPQILAASDIFVLSSSWEGFGLVLLEAMAAAKPIVTTNVGIVPEIIKKNSNSLLVSSSNVKNLSFLMQKLILEKEKREFIGEQAKKFILSHYSISKMVKRYEKLYLQFR